jgi:hypothetical protein
MSWTPTAFFLCSTEALEMAEQEDRFMRIAARKREERAGLVEPQPKSEPFRRLESSTTDPRAAFKPLPKIDTPEKLLRELDRQRRWAGTFMRNLTPDLSPVRTVIPLETFDYKVVQADEPCKENLLSETTPSGWQVVKIPHYGGPLGRATAYYRTVFSLSESQLRDKACWICFKGVDYKAHVFVNGTYLGSHEGFFAPFEFDFTRVAKAGENVLVVRVENDAICMGNESWGADGHLYEGDKIYGATGMGFDDPELGWHDCPPGMGIYQAVSVEIRGKIHIADVFVRPFLAEKLVEVRIELESTFLIRQDVKIEFSIFGRNFKQTVTPKNRHAVQTGPTRNYYRFPVTMKNPRAWNPAEPWLYQVQVHLFDAEGKILDTRKRQFGMRDFVLDTDCKPKGMFYLNGRPIRLRGANEAGHAQQCVAKKEWDKLRDAVLLAKICHQNFWRMIQRPVQDEIYEMCDQLGLMTQTDLPLFGMFRRNQFCEGIRQAEEMERLVRSHPCNIVVSYINEPCAEEEKHNAHRQLTKDEMNAFFVACDQAVRLANPDRVIKPVDGDYDQPHEGLPDNHCYNCWYNGHGIPLGKLIKGYWQRIKPGWNYACGEFGAEGLDSVSTMLKHYPKNWLPANAEEAWTPSKIAYAQTGHMHYSWFTTPRTLSEWVAESQEFQAWATRTMTEAFRRDERMVSFALYHFIDEFPAGWMKAIMDVDQNPKPAYFAYREALTPLAVNIRADRYRYFENEKINLEFWICNDGNQPLSGCTLHYQIRENDKIIFAQKMPAVVPALKPAVQGIFAYRLPKVDHRTELTVEVAIKDGKGKVLHDTRCAIEVFPFQKPAAKTVFVVGDSGNTAWQLARELGLKPEPWKKGIVGTILASCLVDVQKNKAALETAVEKGSRLVLTDLALTDKDRENNFELCGEKVTFQKPVMGPRFFVNCRTDHPLVSGFRKNDFFLWHHARTDMIEPILPNVMTGQELEPILLSGQGDWQGKSFTAFAAAEKKWGAGQMIISLVDLLHRIKTNPSARDYALKMCNAL